MGETNSSDGHDHGTSTFRHAQLGVRWRPAPLSVPILAGAVADLPDYPASFDWGEEVDLTGADGEPDALGNLDKPVCVAAAALRDMQMKLADGRKPTEEQAVALFDAWGGSSLGLYPDEAFSLWAQKGFKWSEQRLVVPRLSVIERDGVAPNLAHLKTAIYALGGVIAIFRMPQSAMSNFERWDRPKPGTADAEDAGYHAVNLTGANSGCFNAFSWGHKIQVSYPFLVERLAQAWAFPSFAWIRPTGKSPSGLTFDQLQKIGARITE